MPYINKVRLVNVRFNNNTSRYEDLKMSFDSKSSTYELINGGGKSVLLMMLLQVVLPNESLKTEKPVKNIFIDTKDITSHVLVEWTLEDGGYYTHLLTGFCARKSRDKDSTQGTTDGGIDYYNYTFLYNGSDPNDIYNLGLFNDVNSSKSVMSYHELKGKLNKLKDSGLPIEIFENKKGRYQEALQQYQIINAEWDILKKINVRENNLANYFREDKSSRKLIENFLVKIVDKVGENKDKITEEEFVNLLIKMKDTFAKLQREYELLDEYEQYDDALYRLIGSIIKAIEVFKDVDEYNRNIASVVNALSLLLRENKESLAKKNEMLKLEKERLNDLERDMLNLDVIKNQLLLEKIQDEEYLKNEAFLAQEDKGAQLEKELQYLQAVNKYFEYIEAEAEINSKNEELKKLKMSDSQLILNREKFGKELKFLLDKKLIQLNKQRESIKRDKSNADFEVDRLTKSISELHKKQGSFESKISEGSDEVNDLKSKQNICNASLLQSGEFRTIIYDADVYIKQKSLEIEEIHSDIVEAEEEIQVLNEATSTTLVKLAQLEGEKNLLNKKVNDNEKKFSAYQSLKEQVDSLALDYEKNDVSTLKVELINNLNNEYSKKAEVKTSIKDIDRQLKIIEEHGIYVFNEKLIELHDYLKRKFNVVLGSEYLKSFLGDERKALLMRCKLLPYSIMLPQSEYNKIRNDLGIIGKKFMDTMIPIVNWDAIKQDEVLYSDNIVFSTRDIGFHLNSLDNVDDFKDGLIKKKEREREKLDELESGINIYQDYLVKVRKFLEEYPKSVVDDLFQGKSDLSDSLSVLQDEQKQLEEEQKTSGQRINVLSGKLVDFESQKSRLKIILDRLKEFKEISESISKCEEKLNGNQSLLDRVTKEIYEENEQKEEWIYKLDTLKNQIHENNRSVEDTDSELSKLTEFDTSMDIHVEAKGIEVVREQYRVYNDRYKQEISIVGRIQGEMEGLKKKMKKLSAEIGVDGYSVDLISEDDSALRVSVQTIKDKKENIRKQKGKLEKLRVIKDKAHDEFIKQQECTENILRRYKKNYGEFEPIETSNDLEVIKSKKRSLGGLFETYTNIFDDIEEEISELKEKLVDYNKAHTEFKVFADSKSIDLDDFAAIEIQDVSFEDYSRNFNELEGKVKNIQRKFNSEKDKLIKSSSKFTVRNFRNDIENVEKPSSLNEAETILNSLKNYLLILKNKKEKILIEIEHEKELKDSFVQQCVSAGVWIYEQLMKLNTLSKIKIPELDIRKPMVELELKCYDQETQIQRMENHINNLVERINEDNKSSLSKELSSKAFLSQVVDINSAKVYLYKVEDIVRNSRRVRWEHAVESDGQTHTLYFLFLASIITFIRKLSAGSENTTKKVLIIDNPFGSASAVYLWRIMFAMMKENNFQLISAGHNISKEILPFFEVNYLLDENIISNGRKKVVVHNFRGIVENKMLSDEEIRDDQISLFNM